MRKQTIQMNKLLTEFRELKNKLFGNSKFVILNEKSLETKRYNQLFMFFYPSFRNGGYKNPLDTLK